MSGLPIIRQGNGACAWDTASEEDRDTDHEVAHLVTGFFPGHSIAGKSIDTAPAIPTMAADGAARRAAKREPGGIPGLYPQL